MDLSLTLLAAIIIAFLVAGVVKGATGMGLPAVAMGLLTLFISPLAAATLMLVPSTVTNVWQLATGPRLGALVGRLWPMMAAVAVATFLGSTMLARGETKATTCALGVALAAYATYTLLARQLHVPARWMRWLSPAVGLATGTVTGATGVFMIPAVPYLQALDLEKEDLVQALGLSFTVSTLALAVGLAWHGALPAGNLAHSLLAVMPALAGMRLGHAIRVRVSPTTFRRWFLVCLLLLGVEMASRPWR